VRLYERWHQTVKVIGPKIPMDDDGDDDDDKHINNLILEDIIFNLL
jgi:hypothetical protein